MFDPPATRMRDPICFFGGMFESEHAQQLLERFQDAIESIFGALHAQCAQKLDGDALFAQCVDSVCASWGNEEYAREVERMGSDALEANVRGAFIAFVRQRQEEEARVPLVARCAGQMLRQYF